MSSILASHVRRFTPQERVSNVLFVLMHLSVLMVFVVPVSWRLIGLAVGGYGLRMWAVTAGYHRYFAHRTYKTSRAFQLVLAILGATSMQNGPIWWASVHRRHHKLADGPGDPHSPAHRGFWYAHIGWVFSDMEVADEQRYAKDLLADPLLVFVDRTFVLWVVLGLALPFGLGVAVSGTIKGGLTALLWGGALRIFVMHHATFSINSLCHFFGKQDYETTDESRNLAWLAIPTWGEAWHNTHHAFPTSYRHGADSGQVDLSAEFIEILEKLGVAWDVVRIPDERRRRKRATVA